GVTLPPHLGSATAGTDLDTTFRLLHLALIRCAGVTTDLGLDERHTWTFCGRLNRDDENPIDYIVRHMNLDPGALGAADQLRNLRVVRAGAPDRARGGQRHR